MIRSDWQDMGALPVYEQPKPQQQPKQEEKPKRSGWKSWVPMGAGLLASLAAAPFTGGASLAGTAAILGGAGLIGGGAGEWAAQKLNKEKTDVGRIAKEGIVSGALSAIPLGKLGQLGRGGAKTVAKEAGESAATGGARDWLSKKLLSSADDMALSSAKVGNRKAAMQKFAEFGGADKEKLGTFIRRTGSIGKNADEIEQAFLKDAQSRFGTAVKSIERKVTTSDVLKQNQKSLKELLDSPVPEDQKIFKEVSQRLKDIFGKKGDAIDPVELNKIRAKFDAKVNYTAKMTNPEKYDVNKRVADYLRTTLQGVSKSDDLKKAGLDISKAKKAMDIIGDAASTGKGNSPFGLLDTGALATGGVVGGVPGAAVAYGTRKVMSSPKVQSFIAQKLASTGEKLASTGARRAATDVVVDTSAKGLIKQAGKSQLPGRTLQALMQGGGEPTMPEIPATPEQVGAFDSTGAEQDQVALMQMLSGGGAMGGDTASDYSREAMMADIKRDPTNMKEYMALYESLNPVVEEAAPLSLSDSAITKTTDAQKALQGLDELDTILADGYAGGKVSGNIRKLNPFDDTFKTQQASIDRIRQIVGKALEGGVLRKEDEEKYKKILPTMQDQPEVYRAKVAQLRQMIGDDMQQYLALQQQYGKGAGQVASTDLTSILGAQ